MESPEKQPETSSASLESDMTDSIPQTTGQEANENPSGDIIVTQSNQTMAEALHAFGITTENEEQDDEGQNIHLLTTVETHQPSAPISNTLEPPPIRTRPSRSRRRGRTLDQELLAYTIANPPRRVILRRYRSTSEMDCTLGKGYIERSSVPSTVNTLLAPPGFWDVGPYRFCLRCGSDHF